MTSVLLALVLVALAVGSGLVVRSIQAANAVLEAKNERIAAALESLASAPEEPFRVRLADLEDSVERLPQKWEEFKNEARRAEARARSIVRDAQKELEGHGFEHAGLEAQAGELRIVDGDQREGERVSPVREDLEGPTARDEDWRSAGMRRKFGVN